MTLPLSIIYVTRDIERAAGMPFDTEGFFVVTNSTPESEQLSKQFPNIIIIAAETHLDTHELLERDETAAIVDTYKDAAIVVFKNSTRIERICAKKKWTLLNSSAEFASTVEAKISQVAWLGELSALLPPHEIKACDGLMERDIGRILQFNFGHTGTSTMRLEDMNTIQHLTSTFPKRAARVADFITGLMCTLNAAVTKDTVVTSTISYQITGIKPFTDNPYATIGNDWVFPKKVLSKETTDQIHTIAKEVGAKLQKDGWKGLFGIDVLIEKGTHKVYLIEINARQPASVSYESSLQTLHPTTMEAHLLALLDAPVDRIAPVLTGALMFDRRSEPPITHRFSAGVMASDGILDSAALKKLK
jgi:predicted ATP-grasp superfamily ATP-dependent carboligase